MLRATTKSKRPSSESSRVQTDASASASWEARLCELEFRLTQLESENRKLRNACQKLETASASNAKLYEVAPVGLVTLDPEGRILGINIRAAALIGREPARLLQRRFVYLVVPEDVRSFTAQLRDCRRSRKMVSRELRLRSAAGEPLLVQFATVPVLDLRSRVTQLEAALVDLTEQRRAEAALRSSEQNLRTFIESSLQPLQLLDANARWLLANPAALELFNLTGTDYQHKRSAELAAQSPFYRAVLAARERKERAVLETGLTSRSDERIPKPDGSNRLLDVIRVALFEPGGRPRGLAVLSYDVTERKQAEATMELTSGLPLENPFPVLRLHEGRVLSFANPAAQKTLPDWGREVPVEIVHTARACLKDNARRSLEWQFGGRVYEVNFAPIAAAGYVNLYFNDITERKQVEYLLARSHNELDQRVRERTAELTAANAALVASENRFRGFVESAPDGIVIVGDEGRIEFVNARTEQLFGYPRQELEGQSLEILLPKYLHERHKSHRKAYLAEPHMRSMGLGLELFGRHKDGSEFPVEISLSPLHTLEGILVCAGIRDITKRKQAEKALFESEARLAAILDHSPAMIYLKDTQGRYLLFNREYARTFRLSPMQDVGKTDTELFHKRQAGMFRVNEQKVLATGMPLLCDEVAYHDDGPHIRFATRFPLRDSDGKIYAIGGIITDVTERRQLEEELLRISEREQQRIAEDLHDGLGQLLTGVLHLSTALHADLVAIRLPQATEAARIVTLLTEAVSSTRALASGLHPVPAEAGGLTVSLGRLAAMVQNLFKVECQFQCRQPVLLADQTVANHLYRIAQEAVNNALKHGSARRIKIVLATRAERLTLTVQNNGKPLANHSGPNNGLGQRIMRHRSELLGGSLTIGSSARGWTQVVCSIRMPAANHSTEPIYESSKRDPKQPGAKANSRR